MSNKWTFSGGKRLVVPNILEIPLRLRTPETFVMSLVPHAGVIKRFSTAALVRLITALVMCFSAVL